MDPISLLAGPLLTALLAPLILQVVAKFLNRRREKMEARHKDSETAITNRQLDAEIGSNMRKELREELQRRDDKIRDLEKRALSNYDLSQERDKWEKAYYSVKKEKERISFELILLRKELETIREQYDQYIEIRERAEHRIDGKPDDQ